MSQPLKIATASINTTALAIEQNISYIIEAIRKAAEEKADILLLPELCISGYGAEDMFLCDDFIKHCHEALVSLIKDIPDGLHVAVGFPLGLGIQDVYSGAALLASGKLLGVVCKQHLALDGLHYEPRWFKPWPQGKKIAIEICGQKTVAGDLLFEVKGAKIGFEICQDAWVETRPALHHDEQQVDVILNPSASHFALSKQKERERIVIEAAQQFHCVYAYANLLGCEAGRAIYDGGNLIASEGRIVSRGARFSYKKVLINIATVNVIANQTNRAHNHNYQPIELSNNDVEEEVVAAISLGLWDWLLKTRTQGFVVSLSGGADSALCAALVFLSQKRAKKSLGEAGYHEALRGLGIKLGDDKSLMPQLLTTVYQGTRYSSKTTKEAASTFASAIGASHHSWSIDELVSAYLALGEHVYQAPFNWEKDDITLQNIQARSRSPGVWLLANKENKLLLATSNLSEASVGYCTMDGDTSGGLAPIGGVSKTKVLSINKYLLDEIPAMQSIVDQTPTAELRPAHQTDEQDLMPYEILDTIRSLLQAEHLSADQTFARLQKTNFRVAYSDQELQQWVKKYLHLYQRNQWKRERLAPSFHIEVDSACPKTFRRYPILSG